MIQTPYLLFLGDAADPLAAKVAQGIKDWRPEYAVGQLRMAGCNADMGLPDMTLAEAKAAGCKTMVIGVANRGGVISPAWKKVLIAALEEGFDLASGLHNLLRDEEDLAAVARATGRTLHDVRVPTVDYPIANGKKRRGKRMLAVGTDCSIGKMYTALCMDKEMRARGLKSSFRATGQTGILITGDGVPLDAVIADFMAGAVEWLTPDNDPDHWGPDRGAGLAVPCVLFGRHAGADPWRAARCAGDLPRADARPHARPARIQAAQHRGGARHGLGARPRGQPRLRCGGVSINTQHMAEAEAKAYLADVEARTGLPATDPFRFGAGKLVDAMLAV